MKARERVLTCEVCTREFQWNIRRGRFPLVCSDFCRRKRRQSNEVDAAPCVVRGCNNRRGYASGICNSCYYRQRRTGTLDAPVYAHRTVTTHGYIRVKVKDHPLADKWGWAYQHRQVLFDTIGPGPHPCHWCGTLVDWIKGSCAKGSLVPDHLDGNKTNNATDNLVPACNTCNATRGLFMAWVRRHADDPLLWLMYQESGGHGRKTQAGL